MSSPGARCPRRHPLPAVEPTSTRETPRPDTVGEEEELEVSAEVGVTEVRPLAHRAATAGGTGPITTGLGRHPGPHRALRRRRPRRGGAPATGTDLGRTRRLDPGHGRPVVTGVLVAGAVATTGTAVGGEVPVGTAWMIGGRGAVRVDEGSICHWWTKGTD